MSSPIDQEAIEAIKGAWSPTGYRSDVGDRDALFTMNARNVLQALKELSKSHPIIIDGGEVFRAERWNDTVTGEEHYERVKDDQ